MDRPFLQTPEWLAFQRSLGRKVWRLDDGFIKANIIRHDVRLGQNFLYIPYGPELNLDLAREGLRNEVSHFVSHLKALAREEGSMFVKMEPTHDVAIELLRRAGVRLMKSPRPIQPMFTVVADLTQTQDRLMDAMHHKHRYNVGLAERKGITVEESNNIDAFLKLLTATAEREGFRAHNPFYYQKLLNAFSGNGALHTRLFTASHGGEPVAAAMMMEHGRTAHYLHGASDREHRALMAPHLLHWTMMKQYKQRGFQWYDFWGIDSRRWPGVTRFKLGWGAKLVEYPGSFDFVFRPFWRWLYNRAPR
jgi:lipid II:glycine glycyltransferase (peptidoglycan interpeptide bridge formation enzyme)